MINTTTTVIIAINGNDRMTTNAIKEITDIEEWMKRLLIQEVSIEMQRDVFEKRNGSKDNELDSLMADNRLVLILVLVLLLIVVVESMGVSRQPRRHRGHSDIPMM
jgi:hypothetical protein